MSLAETLNITNFLGRQVYTQRQGLFVEGSDGFQVVFVWKKLGPLTYAIRIRSAYREMIGGVTWGRRARRLHLRESTWASHYPKHFCCFLHTATDNSIGFRRIIPLKVASTCCSRSHHQDQSPQLTIVPSSSGAAWLHCSDRLRPQPSHLYEAPSDPPTTCQRNEQCLFRRTSSSLPSSTLL